MQLARWTKAQVVFFTGLNTWTATYLHVKTAALIGVAVAAYLAWLSPNEEPEPWRPPVFGDDGQSTLDVVIKFALALIVVCLAWWVLTGVLASTPHR